jgi:hypothetical protein
MLVTSDQVREPGDGVSRREFLRYGGLGVLGLSAAEIQARAEADGKGARACIFLLLNGGPSHIDTLDPKPLAPSEIRGPFRSVSTAVPGVQFAETLPQLAQLADRFAVLRSMGHDAAPIHETGLQLVQAGRLAQRGVVPPSVGSIIACLLGRRRSFPPYVVLPGPLGSTGVQCWQGQGAGFLGSGAEPLSASGALPVAESPGDWSALEHDRFRLALALDLRMEPESVRRRYGESEFASSCLTARRLVEQGVRFVTINMFDSLPGRITWDCHASLPSAPATLADYRNTICPDLDQSLSALITDLEQRGLLEETLIVATGEFGRSPRINDHGGRDHWPGVWSAILAGAGIAGGQVLGASDARGMAPAERPVAPSELSATVLAALGLDPQAQIALPAMGDVSLAEAEPIAELLGETVAA